MQEEDETQPTETEEHPLLKKVSGLGQKIIGEIETIGGVLTGDPNTAAEGEFNVEVGRVREELEESAADVEGDNQ
jgi:uncharacterized protein YjbJ (UPF0337 family)